MCLKVLLSLMMEGMGSNLGVFFCPLGPQMSTAGCLRPYALPFSVLSVSCGRSGFIVCADETGFDMALSCIDGMGFEGVSRSVTSRHDGSRYLT